MQNKKLCTLIPVINNVLWTSENNNVILNIENKGFYNRVLQFLIKKPKFSFIHLDKKGSLVWTLMDGERTINQCAKEFSKVYGSDNNAFYSFLKILKEKCSSAEI